MVALGEDDEVFTDISKERFDEVKFAKERCLIALDFEEKLALLLENYFDFEVETLRLAQAKVIWHSHSHTSAMADMLLLERRIVNLLTSCRLYLDQTDHNVSTLFGNSSDELSEVRRFKNGLYDDNWGYRLMESARNYVQHVGFLVHSISHKGALRKDRGGRGEQIAVPYARASALKTKANKIVQAELEKNGVEEIDLRGPIREYVSCLTELHEELKRIIHPLVGPARATYDKAWDEFSQLGNEKAFWVRLESVDESDNSVVESVSVVIDFLETYDYLARKNPASLELRHKSASNVD